MPKRHKITNWKEFKQKWGGCQNCNLHKRRHRIVLAKGQLPCDVLFIGEAPGVAEDVLGHPFVGPAGKILHNIVAMVQKESETLASLRIAYTNIVCCIPRGEEGGKMNVPPAAAIKACSERLVDFVSIAKPSAIIYVGNLAADKGATMFMEYVESSIQITHPASILRSQKDTQAISIQKVFVDLSDFLTQQFEGN